MGALAKILMIILLLVLVVGAIYVYMYYGTITDEEANELDYKTLNDMTGNGQKTKAAGEGIVTDKDGEIDKTLDKIFEDMTDMNCPQYDYATSLASDPMISLSAIPNRGRAKKAYADDMTYRGKLDYQLIKLHSSKNLMITLYKKPECIGLWFNILRAYAEKNAFLENATAQGYLEGLLFVLQILGQLCVLRHNSEQIKKNNNL
jgi:hypothetical protein